MFTLFGLIALVIAAVGSYGVMAYVVAQRTQEIGAGNRGGGCQRGARQAVDGGGSGAGVASGVGPRAATVPA